MKFYLLSVLPDIFRGAFECGIVGRALKKGITALEVIDLRTFTDDIHRTTDDRPYGGGAGMVLKPEPIDKALRKIREENAEKRQHIVLLSAQGRVFRQSDARHWSSFDVLTLICGRYEGVDERVALHLVDEEISIGDFILSGGEPAAGVVVDAVVRLLPQAVGNADSLVRDSFTEGIFGYPQYTRPPVYRGWAVPEVLAGGDHRKISDWRREKAVEKTRRVRPDLLSENKL